MKNPFYTLFFLLVSSNLLLSQGAQKTLVSSFNLQGQSRVSLDLDSGMEVEKWNGSIIQVQTTVELLNASEAVLKSLVAAGRYKMELETTNDGLKLSTPALAKQVTLSGEPLKETISYRVLIPENVQEFLPEAYAEADEPTGEN